MPLAMSDLHEADPARTFAVSGGASAGRRVIFQQPLPPKIDRVPHAGTAQGADMQSFIIGYFSLSLLVTALWVRPPHDYDQAPEG